MKLDVRHVIVDYDLEMDVEDTTLASSCGCAPRSTYILKSFSQVYNGTYCNSNGDYYQVSLSFKTVIGNISQGP